MTLETIQTLCRNDKLRLTRHILIRMAQRNISMEDVKAAIMGGAIIEDYPNDYPEPSCLILGFNNKRPLHIVCGIHDEELWLITAYQPNTNEWYNDFKTRKE